jgi:ribosome-associated protein
MSAVAEGESRYHSSSPEGDCDCLTTAVFLNLPARRTNRPLMNSREEDPPPPSKTQRKRAMEELQTLGEDLVALPSDRLRKIALPEDLGNAVAAAQRMSRHDDARRRQMQYIGRLMRTVDAEPIREALAVVRGESSEETAKLHRIERLRAELLADEKVVFRIAGSAASVDVQQLRSLRRAALLEQVQGKPPRNYRAIFQLLKELEQTATPSDDDDEHEQP